jgi:hypothetical protein
MAVKLPARWLAARARGALAVAVGLVAARAAPAVAHPELSALGVNRFVTAAILDDRVDVVDALLEGTLASGDERRRLDADGDGVISDAELRAGEARLGAEGPGLTVEVDGRPLTAPLTLAIDLGDERRANTAPVVVERRQSFAAAWPPRSRRLRLAITREPARLLDTELGLVLPPGLAFQGGSDLVTFRGPRASALEERAATFDITALAPPSRAPRAALACLALLALVGAGAVLALRRGRR